MTVLHLDSVIIKKATRLGFEVIYRSMEECFTQLGERTFDCVLMTNLLHLQRDPARLLKRVLQIRGRSGNHCDQWPKLTFHPLAQACFVVISIMGN